VTDDNIASEWHIFERLILDPINAGETQRRECRRAFFAGAVTMFRLVNDASKHPSEDVCVLNMELLSQEITQWADLLAAGKV
jgi:hypothetical protein